MGGGAGGRGGGRHLVVSVSHLASRHGYLKASRQTDSDNGSSETKKQRGAQRGETREKKIKDS